MTMLRWAMGVNGLGYRRNEDILEEARVELIAMAVRKRRLEWFMNIRRRDETENIRAVVEMKLERNRQEENRCCDGEHSQKGHESLEHRGGMGL